MPEIEIDVWLYGALARYGPAARQGSFANLQVTLPEGSKMTDLLARLGLRTQERGLTFVNGQLSAMPGLQPDLGHVLQAGDRVGLFDLRSMWPFQYRHGARMTQEMASAVEDEADHGSRVHEAEVGVREMHFFHDHGDHRGSGEEQKMQQGGDGGRKGEHSARRNALGTS